jgi:tetratricopeptide (TPR) repeat protein
MKMIRPFYKFLALILLGMILTQCSDKNSGEYVKEGLEHLNHEQYDTAKKLFLKAIEKNANNADGYYSLGGIYNYQKKFEDAEQAFKSVLKIDPTHHNAWYSLGYTYELMGKKDEAEESYKKYRRLKGEMDTIMGQKKS